MANLAHTSGASSSRMPPGSNDGKAVSIFGFVLPESAVPSAPPMPAGAPDIGAVAVVGRLGKMEDAVSVKASLCSPVINRFRPVHYIGVFDGHGGPHFALMCKQKLHEILRAELLNMTAMQKQIADENALREIWRIALNRVFWRTELVAGDTCLCGSKGFRCDCAPTSVASSGTSAVVVVLVENHIVAANCGDSRAVLSSGGNIFPLTSDHKPDRADEKARIEASGGLVIFKDVARVDGILATSRAIGHLKLSSVISEPEVTFTRRRQADEFLIIASDGMWDVIPTTMACHVVRQCLKKTVTTDISNPDQNSAQPENDGLHGQHSRSTSAATLLTRLAKARGSADDITVVVVDLKSTIREGRMEGGSSTSRLLANVPSSSNVSSYPGGTRTYIDNHDTSPPRTGQNNFERWTVDRLRSLLRENGLTVRGRKDELIARLRAANIY